MRRPLQFALLFNLSLLLSSRLSSQCTFTTPYGSATINNTIPGFSVTITTCQFGGEFATLNFNVTGAFTFSSSNINDYFTLVNSTNSVIAFGMNPLNASIPTTGTYYLHCAASGPFACATQNSCRTTRVIVPLPPCTGVPLSGTTTASSGVICPNSSATLTLPGSTTGSGMFYQWYSSTTGTMGPFYMIPGASSSVYLTPPSLSVTTWFKAEILCNFSSQTSTSNPVSVGIAATTTNSVPYSEGFEGLIVNNQLPNCSWKASNLPQTCQTYVSPTTNNRVPRTGNKFASFYYQPANTSYFYTNGVYLNPGVTYSASAWYTTEYYTYTNWTNLSLLIGPNQSTVGLQSVATSSGTAASPNYKSISNTFTVANAGFYYLAIRASSNASCCAQYLSIDDISITAPCSINSPIASVFSVKDTVCEGESLTLIASGAHTYSWNTGATSATIQVNPTTVSYYSVVCTNTLSMCNTTVHKTIIALPATQLNIFTTDNTICTGETAVLTAFGANTYTWSNGLNSPVIQVSPLSNTTYSVYGTNNFGCVGLNSMPINVLPLPNINVVSSKSLSCSGEQIVLTASGANTYTWQSGNQLYFGNPVNLALFASGTVSVTGKASSSCRNTNTIQQLVVECTGLIQEIKYPDDIVVYPNPGSGIYTLIFPDTTPREVQVFNLLGSLMMSLNCVENSLELILGEEFPAGIYNINVKQGLSSKGHLLIKQ